MPPIYLDFNATTPVDPVVASDIATSLNSHWGNPSSSHEFGRVAHGAIAVARQQVADLIGAKPGEIVFTGGGSEASNLAIKGACDRPGFAGPWWKFRHGGLDPHDCCLIASAVEHPATAKPIEYLRRRGATVVTLPVDGTGLVDADAVRMALRFNFARFVLVSLMHSNNEVGTLMPIRDVGALKSRYRFLFHTDCAQSLGKVAVDANDLNVDLLTIAGHKLYAPKGVGALYVRGGVDLEPLVHGAGHEGGRRAGTENAPYIVGLGRAAELARQSLPYETTRLMALRDRLHGKLKDGLGERIALNGHESLRLPNTLNVSFLGQLGPVLLSNIPRIAASVGSACHETKAGEASFKPSPVLVAMKRSVEACRGAVRLSLGRTTTEAEVDEAAELLIRAAKS